jgi:GxxExxY protein
LIRHDPWSVHTISSPTQPGDLFLAFLLGVLGALARDLYWNAMSENAIAQQIVDAAFRVHTTLGPGLLESVYEAALAYELEKRGLRITRQQGVPVVYESVRIHAGFYADLVVEDQVIVEIKAVEMVAPVQRTQRMISRQAAKIRQGKLGPLDKRPHPLISCP